VQRISRSSVGQQANGAALWVDHRLERLVLLPPKASFSADETTDVGYESGTTVSSDYTAHSSRFTGNIKRMRSLKTYARLAK
jgi:hypothetical protein